MTDCAKIFEIFESNSCNTQHLYFNVAFLIKKKVIKKCMHAYCLSIFEKFWTYESQVLTSTHHRESSARQNMGKSQSKRHIF